MNPIAAGRAEQHEHRRPRALTHAQVFLGVEHGGNRCVVRGRERGGDAGRRERRHRGRPSGDRSPSPSEPPDSTIADSRPIDTSPADTIHVAATRNVDGPEGDAATFAASGRGDGLDAGAVRPTPVHDDGRSSPPTATLPAASANSVTL